ncbi:MAG: hypothetical protein HFI75_12795 [Lachnospiraceae bacterium]|nr:hypothetical protein [Lachnospiraceae bacterium]
MQNHTTYYKSSQFELIFQGNTLPSCPMHTHAAHWVYGWIYSGSVQVRRGGQQRVYMAGEQFCISPDTPHAIQPAGPQNGSMLVLCLPAHPLAEETDLETQCRHYGKPQSRQSPRVFLSAPNVHGC